MNVYLDTCVLPLRGPLRGGIVSPLLALARRGDIALIVPELVVVEYQNLRRTRAQESIDELRATLKRAHDHLRLQEIYIPTSDEVVEPLIAELRASAEIVPLDPTDAMAALSREAQRIRPARDGRGSRDSAIWLSVVRHHQAQAHQGVMMTTNTSDYASENSRELPHPTLLTDLGAARATFRFAFKPFDFLEEVAPHRNVVGALPANLAADPELLSNLAHAVTAAGIFSAEESGLDLNPDFSIWEVESELLAIQQVTSLKAHEIDGDVLVRVRISLDVTTMPGGQQVPVQVVGWVESDSDGVALLDVESLTRG